MCFSLLPSIRADGITDLTPAYLESQDIRLLMLDFDNTIVPYTTDQPTPLMAGWLAMMKRSRIRLCVVSNSKKDRVRRFCKQWELDCITHAKKPFSRGIRKCLEKYHISPANAALAGDQIYTDTLGANLAGCRSILVKAIHNHNIWLKLRHVAELPFILLSRKRRIPK